MRIFFIMITALFLTSCYSQQPVYYPPVAGPPVYNPPPPGFPTGQTPIGGEMCGGMMGARCANPNDYCHINISGQCGAADQSGVCRSRPEVCTQEYAPVCGCDGRTYSNECTANGNGVSAAHHGQCQR